MKANNKTILSSRVLYDKKVHQHPIAVFSAAQAAKAYATALHSAITAGDLVRAKELDAAIVLDAEGKIVPGVKFSVLDVPYAPEIATTDNTIFED
jgi:hypothetical protein